MKTFVKVASAIIAAPLVGIGLLMTFIEPDLAVVGVNIAAIGMCIAYLPWYKKPTPAEIDAKGVHWFWWVFWLIAFFPALIIVAIIHTGRKGRAASREVNVGPASGD